MCMSKYVYNIFLIFFIFFFALTLLLSIPITQIKKKITCTLKDFYEK